MEYNNIDKEMDSAVKRKGMEEEIKLVREGDVAAAARSAIIDSSGTSGTSTLETYYSNFIARQLYAQKCLKYRKI